MSKSWLWSVLAVLAAQGLASPAAAQSCPNEYAACDNGGCCLSSEQCCPFIEDGCCNSSTPYCCGGGVCAATPSQCPSASRSACDGYDVPCGGGCAPAGSECCDLAGHYCAPETACMSETACVLGDDISPTLIVALPSTPETTGAPETAARPFDDPEDASDRSCAMHPARVDERAAGWLLAFAALAGLRRRRR